MGKNFVITIARGFGSGGKEIAHSVAKAMGIKCYEHSILTLASQMSGVERSRFAAADEKIYKPSLIHAIKETLYPEPESHFVSNDELYAYEAKIIRGLASTESCVIVGKAADYVLRDFENVYSFYIEAPRAYCLENVMSKMEVTEEEANDLITKTDKCRADFYKYVTHGNYWTNPVNYDLTLNSAKVGKENCVKVICDYVKLMQEGK
ncbi:MAG: cytidylate kinase-like family protein [Acutalibacteraceae bacterium]|nr:cytidylate kinase-like family protein [Acutalibacteraceae bacterium]